MLGLWVLEVEAAPSNLLRRDRQGSSTLPRKCPEGPRLGPTLLQASSREAWQSFVGPLAPASENP